MGEEDCPYRTLRDVEGIGGFETDCFSGADLEMGDVNFPMRCVYFGKNYEMCSDFQKRSGREEAGGGDEVYGGFADSLKLSRRRGVNLC
jgi:hypothetical protein